MLHPRDGKSDRKQTRIMQEAAGRRDGRTDEGAAYVFARSPHGTTLAETTWTHTHTSLPSSSLILILVARLQKKKFARSIRFCLIFANEPSSGPTLFPSSPDRNSAIGRSIRLRIASTVPHGSGIVSFLHAFGQGRPFPRVSTVESVLTYGGSLLHLHSISERLFVRWPSVASGFWPQGRGRISAPAYHADSERRSPLRPTRPRSPVPRR